MSTMDTTTRVQAVRRFNRFYTKQVGALQRGWLGSKFSLAEARLLYELAHPEQPTASDIGKELDLDPGYLSRMLRNLHQQGLVQRSRSKADGRRAHLSLTRAGKAEIGRLDEQTQEDVTAMLRKFGVGDQRRLLAAMRTIEQ